MPVDVIRTRMLDALHADGFDDLVPAHMIVLRYPGPEGRRPVEVAARSGMSKQALNYLLGQLETLGYVTRSEDPDDRRGRRVHVTARGWAAAESMRAAVRAVEAELAASLGADELERLKELLGDVNAVLAPQGLGMAPATDGA
jgi:DNA-binding MarR family transcriptional regulator